MNFFKEKKAQGALEYILIIGGAVLIAAVVIAMIAATGKKSKEDINKSTETYEEKYKELNQLVD